MNKSISILGSTGSVGLSALSIIDKKRKFFKVNILSANKNYNLICKQIQKYRPNIFIIHDQNTLRKVKQRFKNIKVELMNDFSLINPKKKTDISISAIPGIAGLVPTILFTKLSKKILIANKESVICGWNLIKKVALKNNTEIIPIDSEHYSIFKLLENHKIDEIKKIYITASGGPFLNFKPNKFKHIKPKDALKHPKWKMGKKISIDSSTLMNKILEFIEAQKLFNIPKEKLDILIHPNSLVHAIVEFNNGLTKFIYHQTTMIIPLANAIFEGKININDFYKFKNKIISKSFENLIFTKVNSKTFPAIKLKNRANEFPSTSIILNASNEVLVDQFLAKKIPFLGIYRVIRTILNNRNYKKYAITKPNNINQINKVDFWAKQLTKELIIKKYE